MRSIRISRPSLSISRFQYSLLPVPFLCLLSCFAAPLVLLLLLSFFFHLVSNPPCTAFAAAWARARARRAARTARGLRVRQRHKQEAINVQAVHRSRHDHWTTQPQTPSWLMNENRRKKKKRKTCRAIALTWQALSSRG